MKNITIISGFFAAITSGVIAQEPALNTPAEGVQSSQSEILSVGLTPQQKKAAIIDPLEFNPFAIINDNIEEKEDYVDISAQEQKIRGVFRSLGVSGVTKSGTGWKVLIGDMILRGGDLVPSVIPEQTEQLEVLSINEEELVLGWVEEETTRRRSKADAGRQLTIPISRGATITPRLPRAVSSITNSKKRR